MSVGAAGSMAPALAAPGPASAQSACFHCGEPLRDSRLQARIDGRTEPVCCQGCLAVAELIAGAGLSDYYRFRQSLPERPDPAPGNDAWSAYAQPDIAAQFTRTAGECDSATLAVDGLRCSACSWLIDQVLCGLDGVEEASTNASTGRTHISWRRSALDLAQVMRAIAQLGYTPHPVSGESVLQAQQREKRGALKHLLVSGFGMMQVMTFAFSVYAAEIVGEQMEPDLLALFRLVSLLVATPVTFYAGAPIFASAWNSLRAGGVGMDVPVSAALVLAYAASVWNTFVGSGEVYFDSVTMFIFFLTLARFIQMSLRHRTTDVSDALARQLPAYAHRLENGDLVDVPTSALRPGEVILVRPGEVIPVDGELIDGEASIDEALLTGESLPVRRGAGERLAAGAVNVHSPIYMRVAAGAAATGIRHIVAMLQRAQAQKPAMSRAADAAAARFLRYVLLGAGLTCAIWLVVDPTRAFEATLAVLVVACPCAFAIAMPAALSASAAHLARKGVLIVRPDALEALSQIDHVVFDKTGTLTRGEVVVRRCIVLAELDENECTRIAAALEHASEHPLARAFARKADAQTASEVRTTAGAGVEGLVNGRRYRIGSPAFVAALRGQTAADPARMGISGTVVCLGDEQRELAVFELHDAPRESARDAVQSLHDIGITTEILSGDAHGAVASVAESCAIPEFLARQTPEQKLAHAQSLQHAGRRVAMIGDGVNDAPVLAAANVSIAMARGTALAHASADMVLVGENLAALPEAIAVARRTLGIARQNMIWAAVYNFGSLPLAALGFVPPWLAALGMSISSIAVVLNATRLLPRSLQAPSLSRSAEGRTAPDAQQSTPSLLRRAGTGTQSHMISRVPEAGARTSP